MEASNWTKVPFFDLVGFIVKLVFAILFAGVCLMPAVLVLFIVIALLAKA